MPMRILIADDETDLRRLVSFALGRHGYEVLEARDGADALVILESERPDLILLDVMMPVMSGYDTLKAIKADPALADIPVIMLSAMSQSWEVAEGMELGAADYICKPFNLSQLALRIAEFLDQTEQPSDAIGADSDIGADGQEDAQ